MSDISAEQVKKLRELTGAGMMDCKNALVETGGDIDKAVEYLREKGLASAAKRAGRSANQGLIEAYIHFNNTVGVLVEVNCETDFVANTDEFKALAKDIALHIASPAAPRFVGRDQVPQDEIEHESQIFAKQAQESGKPENVIEKIVEGKIHAYFKEIVLLDQPFVKDDSKTVQQLLDETSARVGEKVAVKRFVRYKLERTPAKAPMAGPEGDITNMADRAGGTRPQYDRVLLKLSGEAFAPADAESGINTDATALVARQLAEVVDLGVQTAIVVGGGNIWRGRQAPGIDRNRADYMGMLATVMNALALQDALEKIHVTTRVQTAISMSQLAEPFTPLRARRHLEKGRVVIFAAGLGVPYFSTDTCAAQRALEIGADALLKGTKVDGVYTADPHLDPTATRFDSIEYVEVLKEGYQVMDATAISLCMENKLPIIVFDLREEGNIRRVVGGEPIGTLVH